MMGSADVVEVLERLESRGVLTWLDGGWGTDALLGEETRPHGDLDLVIDREDLVRAQATLALRGFGHDADAVPGLPARLVLRDDGDRRIDFHPIAFDREGNGWQELEDGGWCFYPADGLTGVGRVGGRAVHCITAELQLQHHQGYEPTDTDRRDMARLAERFGLDLPFPY